MFDRRNRKHTLFFYYRWRFFSVTEFRTEFEEEFKGERPRKKHTVEPKRTRHWVTRKSSWTGTRNLCKTVFVNFVTFKKKTAGVKLSLQLTFFLAVWALHYQFWKGCFLWVKLLVPFPKLLTPFPKLVLSSKWTEMVGSKTGFTRPVSGVRHHFVQLGVGVTGLLLVKTISSRNVYCKNSIT